ncbi:alpha-L-glutamate ligase [Iodidimonas gelatinilytica]|uniref:Alpha-L-glutamate ligase n=1 Tax=Iodidimonas gelatinilytica TaxID=1236966 RepID=A0A5A7MR97_9PROT|nr:RimK family alpha-L-glutamate ligase [Iodidimonas gelatinilytica]GEQ97515.1 alpha-L-glutamate ligase [Iodidimonas gelatinilytica]
MENESVFSVGWEEWVALPALGIPAIRAKVDTGAQTSSLHAFSVHPYEKNGKNRVRFGLHPLPERPEIELYCEADLVGQREITSSNGETELRFIIRTLARIGDHEWPIEMSLTNRETMSYRMLLGRRALEGGLLVDVTRSCIQGTPDLSAYDSLPHVHAAERPLNIALLTGTPKSPTVDRLVDALEARSHAAHILDVNRCYMSIDGGQLDLFLNGKALPRFDAALPYLAAKDLTYGLALLRHLETMGVRSLNSSVALAAAWDRLHTSQRLARRGVPQPSTGVANAPDSNTHLIKLLGGAPLMLKILEGNEDRGSVVADTRKAADSVLNAMHGLRAHVLVQEYVTEAGGAALRCLMVGRKLVGCVSVQPPKSTNAGPSDSLAKRVMKKARPTIEERRIAAKAMAALNLQAAIVDLVRSENGPLVVNVDPAGAFEIFEGTSGLDVAGAIVSHLESRVGRGAGYSRKDR